MKRFLALLIFLGTPVLFANDEVSDLNKFTGTYALQNCELPDFIHPSSLPFAPKSLTIAIDKDGTINLSLPSQEKEDVSFKFSFPAPGRPSIHQRSESGRKQLFYSSQTDQTLTLVKRSQNGLLDRAKETHEITAGSKDLIVYTLRTSHHFGLVWGSGGKIGPCSYTRMAEFER